MFQVGEYIVHPGQGVCRVDAVVEGEPSAYQLLPVGQRHPMRISFPVASESRLRPVLSRDEAEQIIAEYPSMELDHYEGTSSTLEEAHFKHELRQGSCLDSVRIAKTFRARIDKVRASNKKPPVVYERILKQATQRSLSELAVALGSTPDDVLELFRSGERSEDSQN